MKLAEILNGIAVVGSDIVVTGLTLNSREVQPGFVFLAVSGSKAHGLAFAEQAIENGAAAIVYDIKGSDRQLPAVGDVPLYIGVENLRDWVGIIAARFYRNPTRSMQVIGITGTNGKTSCSQFLAQLIPACGVIGTLGWGIPGSLQATHNTTPDAVSLQRIMATFVARKMSAVAMEVSSHGLEQGRTNGIIFTGAVFTNISRDHLDYHGSMDAYINSKLALLSKPALKFVVINDDDAYSERILAAVKANTKIWKFSVNDRPAKRTCVTAVNVKHSLAGMQFDVRWSGQTAMVSAPVFGEFNLENIMAVLTTLLAMGYPLAQVVEGIRQLRPVAGRMECFAMTGLPRVFVDYAHTPAALAKVLADLRRHSQGALWAVFGCGGDRDRGKRAQMGRIAEQWADHVVLTSDNPRSENANRIVNDIMSGMKAKKVQVITDRRQAITQAVRQAAEGDTVLVAGKGHEDYQEINGTKIPFSDVEVIQQLFKAHAGTTPQCN